MQQTEPVPAAEAGPRESEGPAGDLTIPCPCPGLCLVWLSLEKLLLTEPQLCG